MIVKSETMPQAESHPPSSLIASRPLRLVGLIAALAAFCVGLQTLARAYHWPLDLTANKGVGQVLLYQIALGSVRVFTTRVWTDPRRPSLRLYQQYRTRTLRGFGLLAGMTLLAQATFFAIFLAVGAAAWTPHALTSALVGQMLTALVIVILLTTTEEILFRGFIFRYLRGEGPRPAVGPAVFGSSLVFTLSHHFHDPLAWFSAQDMALFVGLMLLGILLAVTYQVTGSLACCVGVHTGLVWLDVLRKRMDLIALHQDGCWWMGVNNDLRTAPVTWLFFLGLTLAVWQARRLLRRETQVEGLPG